MTSTDLARSHAPVPRARRQQDAAWLARLEQEGSARFLSSAPPAPASVLQGIGEFNQGEYWQAHETLEAVWRETDYPLRLFYYGLIKLSVGFLHAKRHNAWGARTQFRPALAHLHAFPPAFMGLQLTAATREAEDRLARIERGTAWAELDARPRPHIGVVQSR